VIVSIDVNVTCGAWSRACPAVERLARDAARLALTQGSATSGLSWKRPAELCITLADAAEQQRLNRDYSGRDVPTNVLAFSAWEPGAHVPLGAPVLLGDVVLAFETVSREAADHNKPFADHLRHLVVHGVLHLLGYDHLVRAEATIMEGLETSILAKLGVPDPYCDTMSLTELRIC
jgi:probable rRNA maturation factor